MTSVATTPRPSDSAYVQLARLDDDSDGPASSSIFSSSLATPASATLAMKFSSTSTAGRTRAPLDSDNGSIIKQAFKHETEAAIADEEINQNSDVTPRVFRLENIHTNLCFGCSLKSTMRFPDAERLWEHDTTKMGAQNFVQSTPYNIYQLDCTMPQWKEIGGIGDTIFSSNFSFLFPDVTCEG
nr:hypothetical protein Iba_chr12dCG4150 [Ipomoea batatas]